jgi:hypothetical protein
MKPCALDCGLSDAELETVAREHCRLTGENPDDRVQRYLPDPQHRFLNIDEPEMWRFVANCLDAYLPALMATPRFAAAPDMLAMLERLEWRGNRDGLGPRCPICGLCEPRDGLSGTAVGHDKDCELSALLKRAKGES